MGKAKGASLKRTEGNEWEKNRRQRIKSGRLEIIGNYEKLESNLELIGGKNRGKYIEILKEKRD